MFLLIITIINIIIIIIDTFACNTNFGCQSDWPDMVRYARSLNVDIKYVHDKAMVLTKGSWCDNQCDLQKKLYQLCVERDI